MTTLSPLLLALLVALSSATHGGATDMILTIVNNCRYPVWPAIQPNAGHPVLQNGGFFLPALSHRSFPAPTTYWSGRMWGRTHCHHSAPNRLSCATGDCAGRLACEGAGGHPPATLAQFALRHGPNAALSSYGVSLVDGFNIPMTVTPHEGHGVCPVVGCKADLLATCPPRLRVHGNGGVVACKSGCEAIGSDELCCRGHYNNPNTCRASEYSRFFKDACPSSFTFAHDTPSIMHDCSSPRELKVIFCH